MTQQAKVSLNQWLITAAVGLFGVWGGYQVLQYRVTQVESDLHESCRETKLALSKTNERIEMGNVGRGANEKNIAVMQNDLTVIKTSIEKSNGDIKEMQTDIKKILVKIQ